MTTPTPLYDVARSHGAVFQEWFSWLVARDFGDPGAEYRATRTGVGLFDVSYVGKLRVTGRDRVRFLHNMLSNDIRNLATGSGCQAVLLTHQGRMESDVFVYADDAAIWLECPPAGTLRVLDTLRKYVVSDQVEIEDRTADLAILSCQGLEARLRLREITGSVVEDSSELGHRVPGEPASVQRIVRRDRTGCGGFDLWVPAAESPAVWCRLAATPGIFPAGHDALNVLRTEAGIPWYGVDMRETNLPMEFALDRAVSLNKGCYRGQEIVARVTHRGHLDRRLGGIVVDSEEVPSEGTAVFADGSKVGEVSSAVFSPRLRKPLALAVLRLSVLSPGTTVELKISSGSRSGTVMALPVQP
jgi:folate-binding protein YgfZ